MVFKDREEAGQLLADELKKLNLENPFILAIPRGGVIIGKIVAGGLSAPVDVVVCRKLGVPGHEELGFGAIAPGDVLVINDEIIKNLSIGSDTIDAVRESEKQELARRESVYRSQKGAPSITDKDVVIVDDGIATGVTIRAAIKYIKSLNPQQIIVAAPVCAADSAVEIKKEVEKTVFLSEPEYFAAVGQFYQDFPQTTDEEVITALKTSI